MEMREREGIFVGRVHPSYRYEDYYTYRGRNFYRLDENVSKYACL